MKKLIILLIFIPLFSLSQTLYQTEKRTDIDYKDNVFYLDKKDFLDIYIPKGKGSMMLNFVKPVLLLFIM